ncbi:terminase [Elysia marginata]|uniref:Terminase n=1 Tax=Elysia marginata TaxID=1093978 RepID=A0AAV4G6C6_9GAST|nr:terminase [Elysia marginata]
MSGVLKTIILKKKYKGFNVAYYLPTYPLIRDVAFPKFQEILTDYNISYELNKTDKDISTKYGKIILRSMDNPSFIVGYECAYSLIDEADIMPTNKMREVFFKILGRNRSPLPNGEANRVDFVSTPEGLKFMYNFFIKENNDTKKLIRAKTSDNPFLPNTYLQQMRKSYPPNLLKAYLDGEFVNITSGVVYIEFKAEENQNKEKVKEGEMIFVGLDFNVSNMSAVISVMRDGKICIVDEITGAYDTNAVALIIKDRYKNRTTILPDASGNSRSTSGESDITILKAHGFIIKAPRKNPLVRDRVNIVNQMFLNKKLSVNTQTCPATTQALQNQVYKNGVPDKSGEYDHINDAIGYLVLGFNKKKFSVYV